LGDLSGDLIDEINNFDTFRARAKAFVILILKPKIIVSRMEDVLHSVLGERKQWWSRQERFNLLDHSEELHRTPFGTVQQFLCCLCRVE
jgi:hypothetical protein